MLPSLLYKSDPPSGKGLSFLDRDAMNDLNMDVLLDAMAGQDASLRKSLTRIFTDKMALTPEDVRFRQGLIRDVLLSPGLFQRLYSLLCEGLTKHRAHEESRSPGYARMESAYSKLRTATELTQILYQTVCACKRLLAKAASCQSEAMRRYIGGFLAFFSDAFINEAEAQLADLNALDMDRPLLLSMRLGQGMKPACLVVHRALQKAVPSRRSKRSDRDAIHLTSGSMMAKGLALHSAALSGMLRILQQVHGATLSCLVDLCTAMGFCVGCIQLSQRLENISAAICFPTPLPGQDRSLTYHGLTDTALALSCQTCPVGNSFETGDARITVVTGANQGGKSTFLRSLGLAQVMMQAGLFVSANAFSCAVAGSVHTHFCRAEDDRMESGKLDEELRRMRRIIDALSPNALLLMNESFSATAEYEATAIALEIVPALARSGIRIVFVTHLYDFAHMLYSDTIPGTVFLRAKRGEGGERPFRVSEGPPLPTSYGMDLFHQLIQGHQ